MTHVCLHPSRLLKAAVVYRGEMKCTVCIVLLVLMTALGPLLYLLRLYPREAGQPSHAATHKTTAELAEEQTPSPRKQLYVGVMTAGSFIHTRALSIHRTWGRDVDTIQYFTGTINHIPDSTMSIISLEGLNDTQYPPQTKMFRMIEHMCEHEVDNYHWFIRADDDVYIKVDVLMDLLNKVDKASMVYMGQHGEGRPKDLGRIHLGNIKYCMGGPGVIFSRTLLQALCPHIAVCEREVESVEEDVELGRCIWHHLGIQCTYSYEVAVSFFHAYPALYPNRTPFLTDLATDKNFKSAITLHYAKLPHVMYNLRYHHLAETKKRITEELQHCEMNLKQLDNTNLF